jgi:hypothetical protein
MDRSAVTRDIDGFAVARDMRRSRPMGIVADLATYTAGHYRDAPPLSIAAGTTNPVRAARILFPTSPTCGIIPPHAGHIGIRHPQMGRIQ